MAIETWFTFESGKYKRKTGPQVVVFRQPRKPLPELFRLHSHIRPESHKRQ